MVMVTYQELQQSVHLQNRKKNKICPLSNGTSSGQTGRNSKLLSESDKSWAGASRGEEVIEIEAKHCHHSPPHRRQLLVSNE